MWNGFLPIPYKYINYMTRYINVKEIISKFGSLNVIKKRCVLLLTFNKYSHIVRHNVHKNFQTFITQTYLTLIKIIIQQFMKKSETAFRLEFPRKVKRQARSKGGVNLDSSSIILRHI